MEIQVSGRWPCFSPKLEFPIVKVPPSQTTRQICIQLLPLAIDDPGFIFPYFLINPIAQHPGGWLFGQVWYYHQNPGIEMFFDGCT